MARNLSRMAAALSFGAALLMTAPIANAQQLTKLRVTNFANAIVLGLYYGLEKGYYKEAGLDVELVNVATGAASVSAVASAQADIGWAAVVVPIFARSNGVNIKVFMTASQEGPPDHYGTFFPVSGKSGINSWKDVKGKTVMINAFGTAGEVGVRERLMLNGISWDDVKKVTVPFPQMPAALELGNADLAVTIEPMSTAILTNKAIGGKLLDKGTLSASHKIAVTGSVYFASDDWIAKNRETALKFGRAYARAQKELEADNNLRLTWVMKMSGMDRATAEKVPATWFKDLAVTKEALLPNYDTLVKIGMLQKPFPVDDVFVTLPY